MEPDGLLPLWGLEGLDKVPPHVLGVMVHEGAKAAARVRALLADSASAHPWKQELRRYIHIGWPGGVKRARDIDWEPIKRLDPTWVCILACDHDVNGVNVAGDISSILSRSVLALRFDDNFGEGFDLADAWPQESGWWNGPRYLGPSLDDCLFPATWATESYKVEGSDKPVYKVRSEFAKEWLWVEDLDAFVHRQQVDRIRGKLQVQRQGQAVQPCRRHRPVVGQGVRQSSRRARVQAR